MPTVSAAELRTLTTQALIAAGASAENAGIVADHLVLASLSGVDTHGVALLPDYVAGMHRGGLDGRATPAILQRGACHALVSGNWTFGQVAALFAIRLGIDIAREQGVAVVGLVRSDHIGRLGHFTEVAAEAGCISQIWTSGFSKVTPNAMPHGGRERLLHTNPLSMGFPAGEEPTMMFDFATTALAGRKVDHAERTGEHLPAGCIVDRMGRPTTNPRDYTDGGGHIPFGGHKGYALSMAVEFLGHVLLGSSAYAEAGRGSSPLLVQQAVTFVVLRADLFRSRADYDREADEMERRTRAIPPAEGVAAVQVPGDPERRARAERHSGIPISDADWERLAALPR
ncbi:MAG: Ldh family oxidoreductase [Actinomycetales bacterium]|nr:Ldh family oxidoreductase [Actinomycetales bacterium]